MAPKCNQLNYKNRKVLIQEIMQKALATRGALFVLYSWLIIWQGHVPIPRKPRRFH